MLLVTTDNGFVTKKDTAAGSFLFNILGQVGLNTAFGRVNFQAC